MYSYAFIVRGLALAAVTALYGCGGGGGGGGGSGTPAGGDAYAISTSSVSFSATQGASTPASQDVTVTALSGFVFVTTSQSGGGFSHSLINNGQTIRISPNAPLTPGTFTGTITVTGCRDIVCTGSNQVAGSPKTINVTYTVAPGTAVVVTATPPTVDFVTTTGNIPPSQSVTLSLNAGAPLPWAALGTPSWLALTPTSGSLNPSQTITFSITSAPLAPQVMTTMVTFGVSSMLKDIPVTLVVNSFGVNFVSPYVATASVGGNVIIRGYGFSGATSVDFNGTPASAFTVVSDTEIRATHPVLAAGSYAVNVGNAGGPLPTRANLVVTNPPAYAATALARPSTPGNAVNLIYDAERGALYLVDPANSRIERYSFSAGSWSAADVHGFPGGGADSIALAPDGSQLILTFGNNASVSASSLPFFTGVCCGLSVDLGASAHLNRIAFANDGGGVASAFSPNTTISAVRYDLLNQYISAVSTPAALTNRLVVASADRNTLILPTFEPLAPAFAKPVFVYDASSGAVTQTNISSTQTEHASISRNGSRAILVSSELSPSQATTVYSYASGVFTAMGTLPTGLTGFVISPDGSTAYAYFGATTSVRKFDLNTPDGSGGFVQTGTVGVASPGTLFNEMTISPDGGTLFLAGNQSVVILPAP